MNDPYRTIVNLQPFPRSRVLLLESAFLSSKKISEKWGTGLIFLVTADLVLSLLRGPNRVSEEDDEPVREEQIENSQKLTIQK